jgi:hypothetical protein
LHLLDALQQQPGSTELRQVDNCTRRWVTEAMQIEKPLCLQRQPDLGGHQESQPRHALQELGQQSGAHSEMLETIEN